MTKQETLEEAGERLYPNRESFLYRFKNIERLAFTEGAKWQQERSYTENQMDDAYDKGFKDAFERMYSEEEIRKVLLSIELVNPKDLTMLRSGYGEFPDSYELTDKGIDYIIEQFKNK